MYNKVLIALFLDFISMNYWKVLEDSILTCTFGIYFSFALIQT